MSLTPCFCFHPYFPPTQWQQEGFPAKDIVTTADGKSESLPQKPKMGGAEFFKDKTVLFSDGLKGEWSIFEDSSLKIVLMEFLEMNGEIRGDFLRLSTMVDPDEILVLKRQQ